MLVGTIYIRPGAIASSAQAAAAFMLRPALNCRPTNAAYSVLPRFMLLDGV